MLVKVCGMKDRHQIQQLEKLRPDFIGLIFDERSPRFVTEPLDGLEVAGYVEITAFTLFS